MTRAQAVELLRVVGTDEAKALAKDVKRGPSVVDEFTARRIERIVQRAYVAVES